MTLVRIEDFAAERGASHRNGCGRSWQRFGAAEIWGEMRGVWRRGLSIRDAKMLPVADGEAVWRVSVRPSRGAGVLEATAAMGARGYLDWGGGLVMLAGPANAPICMRR